MTQPLGHKVGNIRLLTLMGKGGMGEVYAGYDEKLERRVALKSIRRDRGWDPGLKTRLLREARILSQIDHPSICKIYDYIEGERRDYLVMELVEGENLRQAMRGGLDERAKMKIALGIGRVLVATHAEGIIHRDLKPENVMVLPGGRIKVLDFGIARSVGFEEPPELEDLEESSTGGSSPSTIHETDPDWIAATPMFMSPEQARQDPLTTASDMYSFGLVLQELFTGRPPYDPRLPAVRLYLRAARAETRPVEGLGAELTALVGRLKSLAPAARPTAVDTLSQLEWIRGRPRRRRRRLAALAAVSVLALFAAVMTWQAVYIGRVAERAEAERRHAEAQTQLLRSRQLTVEANSRHDSQPDLGLLLSLEAQAFADTLEARSSMLASLEANPRLEAILRGHDAPVGSLAWSPGGQTLASSSYQTILLWDPETGEITGRLLGHQRRVWRVAWSPDGQTLASCGEDGTLRLWDAATGQPRREPISAHGGDVWQVAYSVDGKILITSGKDRTIRFWDATTGEPRGEPVSGYETWRIAVAGDGTALAFTREDIHVRLWDLARHRPRGPLIRAEEWIWSLAFRPDSRVLAFSSGAAVRLADARSGERLGPPFTGPSREVRGLAWSEDGKLLAAASSDGVVRVWDAATRQLRSEPYTGHSGELLALAWQPGGSILASAGSDGLIMLWDVSGSHHSGQPMTGHTNWVVTIAWSPDGKTLASAGADESIRLWDTATGTQIGEPVLYASGIWAVAFSPGGETLISAGEDGTIRFWDPATGKPQREPLAAHRRDIAALLWAPDGGWIVSGARNGKIALWHAATGERLGDPLISPEDDVRAAALTGDGKILATSGGRTVQLWNVPEGTLRGRSLVGHGDRVRDLSISPDGRTLASVSRDGTLRLWDVETGEPRDEPLTSHEGAIRCVAWRPDGRILATGGVDRTIRLWDVSSREPVVVLRGHEDWVLDLAWSPDGRFLASGSVDGSVVIRDLGGDLVSWRQDACRRARRNLTQHEWERLVDPELPYRRTCPELPPGRGARPREGG